jgi:hypothetical protein
VTHAAAKLRPLLWLGLAVASLTTLPYVLAALLPPHGRSFKGFFIFGDDHYFYLSFVRQAQDGALLFVNKYNDVPHGPGLVNLEWSLVGSLAWLLGWPGFAAYRLVAIGASLLLLVLADTWLRGAGLPESHRLAGLTLVLAGGGFGGLLLASGGREIMDCLDIMTGLFPFLGLLCNPHFTIGTALLLAALWAACRDTPRAQATAVALATALALVRPYDLVLFVALRGSVVAVTAPWRRWLPLLAPLAGLLPVIVYEYWVFYRHPGFARFAQTPYPLPALRDLALALGPAAVLAGLGLRAPAPSPEQRLLRAHLVAWTLVGLLIVVVRPVHYSLQFAVALGFPLLALGALGLARFKARWTWAAAATLGSSALVTLYLLLLPLPFWFTNQERMQAAEELDALCADGDVAFSPPDIGEFVAGLTRCRPYVAQALQPAFHERRAIADFFYAGATPEQRARILARSCARHVVLPGAPLLPGQWLGEATPFRRSAIAGTPPAVLGVYSRERVLGCVPAP